LNKPPILIAVLATLLCLAFPFQARAVDLSVGGTALFSWWDPAWSNGKMIIYTPDLIKIPDNYAPRYKILQSYLYGPDLSIRFLRNFEISTSFRYAQEKTEGTGWGYVPQPGRRKIEMSFDRYDVYARAGYYVLDCIMPYAGLRVELLKQKVEYTQASYYFMLYYMHASLKGETLKFTPEIGLHFAIPASPFFTFLVDCAVIFQSGSDTLKYQNMYDQWKYQFSYAPIPVGKYYAAGCNLAIAARINIPTINTSFTVGAQYRMLGYIQNTKDRGLFNLNGAIDHSGGITCSAMYTFSLADRKGKGVWMPYPSYPSR
jgi:hypothetical protein